LKYSKDLKEQILGNQLISRDFIENNFQQQEEPDDFTLISNQHFMDAVNILRNGGDEKAYKMALKGLGAVAEKQERVEI
jgi:hypothetical protein